MGQARPQNKEATGVLRQRARDSRAEGDAERREEKGSRPGDAGGSVRRRPGESAVVQGRAVLVGTERRARGQASSAQAESSAARAPGLHLLHRLEESIGASHMLAQPSRTLCASRLGLHPLPPRFLSPVDLSFIPILQARNLKNREMSGTAPGTQGPISALVREMEAWIGELTSCSVGGWLGGWIHG